MIRFTKESETLNVPPFQESILQQNKFFLISEGNHPAIEKYDYKLNKVRNTQFDFLKGDGNVIINASP